MRLPRRALTWLILTNVAVYLFQLVYSYAVGFDPRRVASLLDTLALSNEGLFSGKIWQVVTHLFVHSLDSPFHIVFNLLVLFWFGRELEQRWGTRRFAARYFLFGMGGVVASILVGLFSDRPSIGASGAVSGVLASFCIYHWRTPLRLFFFSLTGRGWLIVFILLDFLRLLAGEPIAVQAHFGGMLTAAVILNVDSLNPRVAWLRLKRWRLKRRFRVKPGNKSNGDSRYLH
jgi:membrane associated rhomboid family serine protease